MVQSLNYRSQAYQQLITDHKKAEAHRLSMLIESVKKKQAVAWFYTGKQYTFSHLLLLQQLQELDEIIFKAVFDVCLAVEKATVSHKQKQDPNNDYSVDEEKVFKIVRERITWDLSRVDLDDIDPRQGLLDYYEK